MGCEDDVDECAPNNGVGNCKNGATCTNSPGTHKCNCAMGWKGATCETEGLSFKQATYTVTVKEDSPVDSQAVILTVQAEDANPDGSPTITYEVTSCDMHDVHHILVDSNTGEVKLAKALDYETATSHTFMLTARSTEPNVVDATCTVELTVENVNDEKPVFSDVSTDNKIKYNGVAGTAAATMTVTDADKRQFGVIKSVEVTSGDSNNYFTVSNVESVYKVETAVQAVSGDYTLTLTATDGGDATTTQEVVIHVEALLDVQITFTDAWDDKLLDTTSDEYLNMVARCNKAVDDMLDTDGTAPPAGERTYMFTAGSTKAQSANVQINNVNPAVIPDLKVKINQNIADQKITDGALKDATVSDPVDNCVTPELHSCTTNQGTCNDLVGDYECICNDGFFGKYCNNGDAATDKTGQGAWSGAAPTCEAITCAPLTKGTGVESILDDDGNDCTAQTNAYDTTCNLKCSTGYVPLSGSDDGESGKCGAADSISKTGKFSKNLGCELITCPGVPLSDPNSDKFVATIEGVEKDCTSEALPYGTKCVLSCQSGWIPDETTQDYAKTVTCGAGDDLKSATGKYDNLVQCVE